MSRVIPRTRPIVATVAFALTFVCSPILGQSTPGRTTEEVVVLPPVVVSATRSERPLEGLPVSATIITRPDLLESSSRAVDDALRGIAGVQLPLDSSATLLPVQPSIAMRGMGVGDTATRALVLVDGLPINGAFFRERTLEPGAEADHRPCGSRARRRIESLRFLRDGRPGQHRDPSRGSEGTPGRSPVRVASVRYP